MAALSLVIAVTMLVYAWLARPLISWGTELFSGLWLLWLPLLLAIWLLANRDP